jgi:hypothetical protein
MERKAGTANASVVRRPHPADGSRRAFIFRSRLNLRIGACIALVGSIAGCSLPGSELHSTTPSASLPAGLSSQPTLSSSTHTAPSGWWKPPLDTTWQWQLSGQEIDTSFDAGVYDIDLFDSGAELVASLHLQGRRAVCYLSAGSWEDWRPDAAGFPKEILGKDYEGWSGEKWLDIRRIDRLAPILRARLDLCKAKGFDAVEPDNVDGYQNETGFPLTAGDQLTFNRWLAHEAHARGLAIALKNDADQIPELLADFDFALTEDCFDQGWCELTLPFLQNGKPVLDAEYTDSGISPGGFCPRAKALGIRAILKHRSLDAWRQACP